MQCVSFPWCLSGGAPTLCRAGLALGSAEELCPSLGTGLGAPAPSGQAAQLPMGAPTSAEQGLDLGFPRQDLPIDLFSTRANNAIND